MGCLFVRRLDELGYICNRDSICSGHSLIVIHSLDMELPSVDGYSSLEKLGEG